MRARRLAAGHSTPTNNSESIRPDMAESKVTSNPGRRPWRPTRLTGSVIYPRPRPAVAPVVPECMFGLRFGLVLGATELVNRHELEESRRSVAMLTTGAPTFDREEALQLLATIGQLLDNQRSRSKPTAVVDLDSPQ